MHYQPLLKMAIIENWLISKCCIFVKIHFFSIILLHAYLQYLWHISAKYQKRILKAVGEVDFTKYALLAIWQTFYDRFKKSHNSCKTEPLAPKFISHVLSNGAGVLKI